MTQHKPVLLKEVLELLDPQPGDLVVDGTFGGGGHSRALLQKTGSKGRLIALDQDKAAVERASQMLISNPNASVHHANFINLGKILTSLNISSVDRILLDLGISSDQLEDPERGFSFEQNGPLDMRMNTSDDLNASEVVNRYSEEDLTAIFLEYGEEKFARRFAHDIVRNRPIHSSGHLVEIVEMSLPKGLQFKKGHRPSWARRHPATRIFQALRIAVNQELDVLKDFLSQSLALLNHGGRMAIISFHSLEDRIVKHTFQEWYSLGQIKKITKKAVQASSEEEFENPRSRSAKLRVIEKL